MSSIRAKTIVTRVSLADASLSNTHLLDHKALLFILIILNRYIRYEIVTGCL